MTQTLITPDVLELRLKKLLAPKDVDPTDASLLFEAALLNEDYLDFTKEMLSQTPEEWKLYGPFFDLGIACRNPNPSPPSHIPGKSKYDLDRLSVMFEALTHENYKRIFGSYPNL